MYETEDKTVVVELDEVENRGEAVKLLSNFRKLSKDGQVSLTADPERVAQWQKIVSIEKGETPRSRFKES